MEPDSDSETCPGHFLCHGQHIGSNQEDPVIKMEVKTELWDVGAVKEESINEVTVEEHKVSLGRVASFRTLSLNVEG